METSFGVSVPPPSGTPFPLPARRGSSKMVSAVLSASRVSGLLGRALPRVGRPMSRGAHGEEGSGTGARVGVGASVAGTRPGGAVTLAGGLAGGSGRG